MILRILDAVAKLMSNIIAGLNAIHHNMPGLLNKLTGLQENEI